jgi:dimethylhistidine N-methyltransferase
MTLAANLAGRGVELFAAEVAEYLQREPRQLPSKYLYDALGSSLFEAICRLPWYRITRAESALLSRHARDILGQAASPFAIAELGCGNGDKLALLLEGWRTGCREVHLIDMSSEALERARDRLRAARVDAVHLHATRYEEGFRRVVARRSPGVPLMVLFLGSNIGNFDPPAAHALLTGIRDGLRAGDWLLLGNDLIKPEAELRLAYDDPLQVTAAFNRNLLRRINDELGGSFDLDAFAHRAIWNAGESRVEMHLVSLRNQDVRIDAADLEVALGEGETIWTESSYKYEAAAVIADGVAAGFTPGRQWIDEAAGFALTSFTVAAP